MIIECPADTRLQEYLLHSLDMRMQEISEYIDSKR